MVWGLRFRVWGLGFNDAALSSTGFLRSTGACLTISRAWGGGGVSQVAVAVVFGLSWIWGYRFSE